MLITDICLEGRLVMLLSLNRFLETRFPLLYCVNFIYYIKLNTHNYNQRPNLIYFLFPSALSTGFSLYTLFVYVTIPLNRYQSIKQDIVKYTSNINQYQKMNKNGSLKEISLNRLKCNIEKPISNITNSYHLDPLALENINLEHLNHISLNNHSAKYLKKICKSQKKLDNYSYKGSVKQNKVLPQYLKTQRSKIFKDRQNIENIHVPPFELHSSNNQGKYINSNVLTPINRNTMIFQQAKKPKILMRQRQVASFSQQFRLGVVLGKGRFGNVYRAQHIATKMIVAVKEISLQKICRKLMQRIIWQIKIQSFLKHANCLQLYKVYKQGNSLYLVIEHGDSSLFDRLRQKKYFTEVETCYYITQTIKALIHLHNNGIIHRDIKPQNLVLINNIVKLADFGWSVYAGKHQKRTTFCGTLDYICPEIVLGNEYDNMVDVWSIGVLCYELCTGHAPFESSKSREETYSKIVNVDIKYPKYLSEDIKDFISSLLTKKPQNRMTLQQSLTHKWIKKYFWQ